MTLIPGEYLTVTVSKTADGKSDYLQILSADQFALNIVLIADRIEVKDVRQLNCPDCGGKLEHMELDPRDRKKGKHR